MTHSERVEFSLWKEIYFKAIESGQTRKSASLHAHKVVDDFEMSVIEEINKMNLDELNIIIDAVKRRQQELTLQEKAQFKVGDTVSFKDRSGKTIVGTIKKVNRKTIIIDENDKYKEWKVSPGLLNRV